MMDSSGATTDLSDTYLEQLEAAAVDPDTPSSMRPSQAEIDRARNERHIPLL